MSARKEEWRDIPGFGGWYQINRHGEVRTFRKKGNKCGLRRDTPTLLKPFIRKKNCFVVKLTDEAGKASEKSVANIMATVWLGEIPEGWVVWQRDGDPTNVNLYNIAVTDKSTWASRSRSTSGFRNSRIKYPVLKIDKHLEIVDCYHSAREAGRVNGMSGLTVTEYCNLKAKRTIFAPDSFIYAWDNETWLRKTLKRAMEELDALGLRYQDPFTEEYYNLQPEPEVDVDPDTVFWNTAPALARGGALRIHPDMERGVKA